METISKETLMYEKRPPKETCKRGLIYYLHVCLLDYLPVSQRDHHVPSLHCIHICMKICITQGVEIVKIDITQVSEEAGRALMTTHN